MAKKSLTFRDTDLTFIALFTVFVIVAIAVLTGFTSYSEMLLVSFATIIAAYTIALQLVNRRQSQLKKRKFNSTELQANFSELEEKAVYKKEEIH
jgi:hypothetical protein